MNQLLKGRWSKKIIPQSEAAKKSLLENLDCSNFKDKIETVYLAYAKRTGKPNNLFVG